MPKSEQHYVRATSADISFADCERLASDYLAEFHRTSPAATGDMMMRSIIRDHGGREKVSAIGELEFELIAAGPRDFTIFESFLHGFDLATYGKAKSFGHYILHSRISTGNIDGAVLAVAVDPEHPLYPERRAVHEAHRFAMGLLMPRERVIAAIEQDPEQAASYLGVTRSALKQRTEFLGVAYDLLLTAPA